MIALAITLYTEYKWQESVAMPLYWYWGKAFSFSTLIMTFAHDDFVYDEVDSCKFILLIMFIMNWYLTLSNAIPASIDMIMWFLSFILLMCITQTCEYLNKTFMTFVWPCIIFLMCCSIWFTDILLNSLQWLYTHQTYLLVNFFSCSSLSGFGTRVILTS